MHTFSDLLCAHRDEVIRHWSTRARQAAGARGLSKLEFENLFPRYLLALADEHYDLGSFSGGPRRLLENHLNTRVRQGFLLPEIVDELRALGESVREVLAGGLDRELFERLIRELQQAIVAATELFARHMEEEEQLEKRYHRLIEVAVLNASTPDPSALRGRLEEVVRLIMEAMDARCAGLLLFDAGTERMELSATTGLPSNALDEQIGRLRPSSFVGQVAENAESTTVLDVATTRLEVNGALRASGVHALLGIRLPPRHALVGVLFIGLSETREFTPREVNRLENLGEQLTLHLDNASLFAQLRDEREVREQMVSMLAHDVRGPLAAAKVAAQMLARRVPEDEVDLATRIGRNVDRVDRMLRDLLDARRIRAGEVLAIERQRGDLGALVTEVVDELRAEHGERFDLRAEGDTSAEFSADEVRRAVWNLIVNALKYGSRSAPVVIRVTGSDDVAVSVHNEGAPIAPEDLDHLFEPFRRSLSPRADSPKGWGLGLALVRGCAEAHGGRVDVESSAATGTTFTLTLPRRPRSSVH